MRGACGGIGLGAEPCRKAAGSLSEACRKACRKKWAGPAPPQTRIPPRPSGLPYPHWHPHRVLRRPHEAAHPIIHIDVRGGGFSCRDAVFCVLRFSNSVRPGRRRTSSQVLRPDLSSNTHEDVGAMRHTCRRHTMAAPRRVCRGGAGRPRVADGGKTRSRLMRHCRHGAAELRETGPDRALDLAPDRAPDRAPDGRRPFPVAAALRGHPPPPLSALLGHRAGRRLGAGHRSNTDSLI